MSQVKSDGEFPRVEGQAPDVFYGSPLAVIAMFVEVIRARFRGENDGTPWLWREDPTPLANEQNEPGAPRTLYIESDLSDDPDARDFDPSITVGKEETRLVKAVVGNFAGARNTDQLKGYWALAIIPMVVQCFSKQKGESANLADHVWMHLVATQHIVRHEFHIHEISPLVLGRTQPFRRTNDKPDRWVTPISFETQVEFRWLTRPIAPRLQEIRMKMALASGADPDAAQQILLDAYDLQRP